jgi:hypothetical protein
MATPIAFFQITHHSGRIEVIPADKLIKFDKLQEDRHNVHYYTKGNATTFPNESCITSCKSVDPYPKVERRSKSLCVVS